MDCDTFVLGRVEAALDWFAPNGVAKSPLGAVFDILGNRTTFNAGVLAVRTNRTLFREMIQAAEKKEVAWDGFWAEQARGLCRCRQSIHRHIRIASVIGQSLMTQSK
jgi:hypothetical protein